jgi:phosphate transport system protein
MVEKFHKELAQGKKDVLSMGNLAIEMLHRSVDALKSQDTELADWVLSKKKAISNMDDKIEDETLRLMTLYQPMAKDMRTIACILKLITYINRVGRYSKDIAQVAKELAGQPHVKKLVSIPYQENVVNGMLKDCMNAFETEDLCALKDLAERDSNVDEMRFTIMRECLTYMMEDQKTITRCMHYIMVSRYLERCGDHACKMGEKIHFMVTGERIEIK